MSIYIEYLDKIYCKFPHIICLGIKKQTILMGISRNSSHWQSIKDPNDRRKRLIAFEPMKEKYKAMVIAAYGDPYAVLGSQAFDRQTAILKELDDNLQVESEHYNYFQKYCTKTKAYTYARVCSWIELVLATKGRDCKGWGFDGKQHFLIELGKYLKVKNLPVSFSSKAIIHRTTRKYKEAKKISEEAALNSVLDGRTGNQNPRKIYEEQLNYLIKLQRKLNKAPMTTVTTLYNREARKKGWKEIDERTAKNYLFNPEVMAKWYLARHGKSRTYKDLEMSTIRKKASAPNVLWMMDGTPIDLYYKKYVRVYNDDKQDYEEKETKWNRLNMFCIMDAHSWKILGYHLSERENHIAVIEALRDTVRKTMSLPQQIMYDQSSANKKVNSVLKELANYNTPNKPYRPKPKALEPLFGHFQQEILRYNENWGGQNITAKKLDSRVNPESLKKAMDNLPKREELEQQIALLVETWNEMATKTREKPNHLYTRKKSKGKAIDWMTFSSLFFVVTDREYTYKNDGGIEITIAKKTYNFQTWDQELYFKRLVNQKFQVAYDVDTMEYVYLYKNNKPVLDDKGQPLLIPRLEALPMAIGDYEAGEGDRVQEYLKAQKEGTKLLEDLDRRVEEELASLDVALSPQFVHKGAYNRAEENLKRQQAADESNGSGADWEELFDNPY